MEETTIAHMPIDLPENPEQVYVANAYLDDTTTIIVALAEPITLPLDPQTITVTDQTTKTPLAVTSVDMAHTFYTVLVGDLQQQLGAQGNWYTDDPATRMTVVHPNLHQLRGTLAAGTYHYKIAFNGVFDGALPDTNVELQVPVDGTEVVFSYVPYDPVTEQAQIYDAVNDPEVTLPTSSAGIRTDVLALTLVNAPDVTHTLHITANGGNSGGSKTVIPRNVLNNAQYVYESDDLGNTYTPAATSFRVWAPTATHIQLMLYATETGPLTSFVAMEKSANGTWYIQIEQNLENWYYLYEVTIQEVVQTAVDPYVKAIAVNAGRGMIVNLEKTNPADWANDRYQTLADPVDAVIYELHVRDFSSHQNSGMTNKGKYLAFTEHGTTGPEGVATGIAHLQELGITHVQVLPIFGFASVDETDPTQYNWGYDPRNYNVPEGAYATIPHGTARIIELKQMMQSLHAAHIGMIMDVVYNHTSGTGSYADFDKIVPQYYYRTNYAGYYTNGSGCGNEVATERPMVQKFVCDSVKYWAQTYHIDGFRFDLMALLGVNLLHNIAQDVRAVNPNVLLYGEPWTGNGSSLAPDQVLVKARQKGLGVGVFNDNIRNALNGNVFDATTHGFVTGAPRFVEGIKKAVAGSIDDFTAAPSETINYATSHDNYTLWDKISLSKADESEEDRIRMDELAQAIVMTAQGVAFMQGGEEILRTKGGNENSYNAGDIVNQFDWEQKAHYRDVCDYYMRLIHLRRNHPAFRLQTAEAIRQHLTFLDSPDNTVMFALHSHANGDAWENIVVLYNPNKAEVTVNLPDGKWTIVATQGRIGEESLGQATGTVVVPPITCMILHN